MARANPIGSVGIQFVGDNDNLVKSIEHSKREMRSFKKKSNDALVQVDKGFGRASKSAAKFGKSLKAAIGIGSALVLGAGLVKATKDAIEFGDGLAKAAKVADISVRRLQELRYAAGQLGVEIRQVDEGVRRFTRRLGAAQTGQGFVAGFRSLIGDPNQYKSAEDALNATISALARLETQQERAQYASVVFGDDAGPKLALLVSEGEEGIKRLTDRAHELGIILSDEAAANAEAAADALDDLGQVLKVNFSEAILQNADAIAELGNQLAVAIPKFIEGTTAVGEFLGLFEETPARELARVNEHIASLEKSISEGQYSGSYLTQQKLALDNLYTRRMGLIEEIEIQKELNRARAEGATSSSGTVFDTSDPTKEEEAMQALEARAKAVREMVQGPYAEYVQKVQELIQLKGLELISEEEARQALEKYREELDKTVESQQNLITTFKDYVDGLGNTEQQIQDLAVGGMEALHGSFMDIITGAKDAGEAFKDFAKTVIDGILEILVYQAIIKPLASAIGAHLGIPGFATGGSFTVGGSGGTDSQFVGFMATPGEQVSISTPAQQRASEMSGGGAVYVEQHNHFDVALEKVQEQIAHATGPIISATKQAIFSDIARGGAAREMIRK